MTGFLDLFGFLSVLLRGFSLAAEAVAFGSACFLLVVRAASPAAIVGASTGAGADVWRWILRASIAGLVAVASAAALDIAALVDATGMTWADAFGARFVAAAGVECAAFALLAALASRRRESLGATTAAVSAAFVVLCASVAISHAAARPDARALALAATLLHQAGAGVWIGGLPAFYATLGAAHAGEFRARVALAFSSVATAGVAMVALGALVLAVLYVGSVGSLYGTAYGMMVVTKTVLLLMLLGLGFLNRRLSRRVGGDMKAAQRLRRFVELEVFIGLAALMLAASLSSAPPGIDLAGLGEQVTLQEIGQRIAPRVPRFASPDPQSLAIAERQARLDAEARSAGSSGGNLAYSPGSGEPPPRNAQDIAWSEYNHHWAGIVVLLVGIVPLVEWSARGRWRRWARWASHWPLLFVVLAAFIAWRADPEVWPMGAVGFLASLKDPEVVQHRVFALLIAALGVFEWAVRNGRISSARLALVFPLLTVVGSILLLTHTHAIGNVKEEALIEITHLPLAVLGLVAGGARWLELRGDARERRIAGVAWRIAFILVGLLLLGYQEA